MFKSAKDKVAILLGRNARQQRYRQLRRYAAKTTHHAAFLKRKLKNRSRLVLQKIARKRNRA